MYRSAGIRARENAPLAEYCRFGIGGPADLLIDVEQVEPFLEALDSVRNSGVPYLVLGGGTNLIVSDAGFRGVVLRFLGRRISFRQGVVSAQSGAELQALVDFSIDKGLANLHSMTRIPGWVGAAVYGNAGAYGHSIMESVERVRFHDGARLRWASNAECEFTYRESVFKRRKDWVILSVDLRMPEADAAVLRKQADEIRRVRDEKFPPTMKCAGSIFKNRIFAELPAAAAALVPASMVREGKVASAWFLDQVGVKGMQRGAIQVADYHANLIYNTGGGTAADLCALIGELKRRVFDRFGFWLEEEVQYVGF